MSGKSHDPYEANVLPAFWVAEKRKGLHSKANLAHHPSFVCLE
jgi:hypothetical protein